jgi:hypothetical protein
VAFRVVDPASSPPVTEDNLLGGKPVKRARAHRLGTSIRDSTVSSTIGRALKNGTASSSEEVLDHSAQGERGLRRSHGGHPLRLRPRLRPRQAGGVHGREALPIPGHARDPIPATPGRDHLNRRIDDLAVLNTELAAWQQAMPIYVEFDKNRRSASAKSSAQFAIA